VSIAEVVEAPASPLLQPMQLVETLATRHMHLAARVRCSALQCVAAMSRASPKLVQGRWALFLPEVDSLDRKPFAPSLVTVIMYDDNAKVREAAADAVSAILDGAPLAKWIAILPIGARRKRAAARKA